MTTIIPAKAVLVDARNIDEIEEQIINELKSCGLAGFDLETQDVNAHAGIKQLRKENAEGDKTAKGKSVFDWRNMVITGLSIYPDGSDHAYYFNLEHADVDNRLPWYRVKRIIDEAPESLCWICHNAPFEITVLRNAKDYRLRNVIDSMQLCVSAYGPDEFDKELFVDKQFGDIKLLFDEARTLFAQEQTIVDETNPDEENTEEADPRRLNPRQQDLLNKVIGKTSDASYSYNGLTYEMSWGYGLKKAVKSFFGYQMRTFEETLGTARHMGELTGQQVVDYGADDAFWAVKLFYKVMEFMQTHCPEAVSAFMEQENPMVYVYADVRCEGMRVNKPAIEARRELERSSFAAHLRKLKATIRQLLPFPDEAHERLAKYDKWYGGDPLKDKPAKFGEYRQRLADWANSPDSEDDYTQACQVSSPVSNAWAGGKCNGLSIGHYYQGRLMMYDLTRQQAIVYKGKISSDAECRGEVIDKIRQKLDTPDLEQSEIDHLNNSIELLKTMGDIASVEQRMKLYLTPYLLLTDPETGRMYPEVTSMLASRRMACSNPNAMQLAKRGESTYVRGFYLADTDDEVLVSLDWSQVELVLIGEFSGDREFAKAFGQIPYNDLHLGAAADVLSVMIPEVTFEMLKNMHKMEAKDLPPKLLVKPNGEPLDPAKAKKYWRTEVGKGSNFNYWYSGALSTVGEKLGWTSSQMWAATERYRERFPEAEHWRVHCIDDARMTGFIQLPDGHRRYRWEATYEWQNLAKRMFDAWEDKGISRFGSEIIRAIKSRAGNQIVNSIIQGTSATLAKRSVLAIIKAVGEAGLHAKFKMPIHDELLFSVPRSEVVDFIRLAKSIMCNHPSIVRNLKLYATASVGLTFEPFNEKTAPMGQIEIDEAPAILGFGDGVVLDEQQTLAAVDYLFQQRERLAA